MVIINNVAVNTGYVCLFKLWFSHGLYPVVRMLSLFVDIFNLFFNCGNIVLQCSIGFCHTAMWISHNYIYSASTLNLPPFPHPLGHHRATGCVLFFYSSFSPAVCFTHGSVYMPMLLFSFVSASPSPVGLESPFSTSTLPFLPWK